MKKQTRKVPALPPVPFCDVHAPIVPNRGLGGIDLRTPIRHLNDYIPLLGVALDGSFFLRHPFEAVYSVCENSIQICVDVRNGKIFKLTALAGYGGKLVPGLTVGMTVREAMKVDHFVYYNESLEVLQIRNRIGISMDLPVVDPPVEKVQDLAISAISVYAEECFTPAGQRGDW